jgi:UDP-N-acetylglucosamine diphosphorylase / glucose-1-phosphate thymidylyltransferase / UDP-N-acetylgalactosamine diphosphorylase / glucosamine-1-phosphate N-acetyltransferase / galactosamine-1-phosphate N-acetyltransferase
MFAGHPVTVVIPCYNEETPLGAVVAAFRGQEHVDRVLVVDNNSRDGSARVAAGAGAEVLREAAQGYGAALRAGLSHAAAVEDGRSILVVTEADGSFRASDLPKLLHYLPDCAMVLGTRTTKQLVQQGANMDFALRWGNVAMGKLLELFWLHPHEPRLTDVGCSYRAVWSDDWRAIAPGTREAGPAFSPEMICEAYRRGLRVIEIPVHYGERLGGESKHSRTFFQVSRTAWRMFRTICRKRFVG